MSEATELRVIQPETEGGAEQSTADADERSGGARRERSTIAFPYDDLDAAIEVAGEVHNTHGGQANAVQLAAGLGQTTKSGAFRLKVSAARLFGVVSANQGTLTLTQRGHRILDPVGEAQAKAEAFLDVPLYGKLYERFKEGNLPDDGGLEAAIRELGVTPKQVQTARQVFQRSAQQAGFFRFGNRKLVLPSGTATTIVEPQGQAPADQGRRNEGGGDLDELVRHPFILGLLRELPDPGKRDFPEDDRKTWLDAAKISFDLIYGKVRREGSGGHQAPSDA
jgi:hypothetical protein